MYNTPEVPASWPVKCNKGEILNDESIGSECVVNLYGQRDVFTIKSSRY